jgi:FtsZ-interacting cell division protein ZipA
LGAGHGIRFTKGERMKIEFVNATVEVVMIIVVIVAFLFLVLWNLWRSRHSKSRKGVEVGFFKNLFGKGKSKGIYANYKNILDSKLIPLGFERQNEYADMREKEISYKRNALKITLHSEPPFSYNAIHAISGKKITLEEHVNQMPPEIRNKTKYMNEQDKYKLVDALDFKIEVSESEEVEAQFLQILEKWLTENQ